MSDQDRSDVDAQFAEIIAHWAEDDALASAGAGPWPEQEGYGPPADHGPATDTGTESGQGTDAPPREPDTEGGRGTDPSPPGPPGPTPAGPTTAGPTPPNPTAAGHATPPAQPAPPPAVPSWGPEPAGQGPRRPDERPQPDPEDHFVPGPTAPLPAGDLQFWGILIGLTGGPLLLLYLILFDRSADSLWLLLAISMTVGGFALLVSRLPRHGDEDDGDDGARL
ncbi:hypothetical protein [Oryzihumus leptocrescens]|uniref:Uncharacterized protein n=1 Tax=Oryzihumus leptocrescens TaxID=297536 RepID=A0A542ZK63_9MICO|nr:hypothetical protein [Oryzihumus leptocrescens]TQL60550.1 hypothetical protein FB474_1945 [Oryzihumus leptocrescens]